MPASRELTEQQRNFVLNFCAHGNAAMAAREAGYSEAVARQTAHKLLLKPHIAAEMRRQAAAQVDAHLPGAVAVLAEIMGDRSIDPKDRIRAAEVLLRHSRPSTNAPAVAIQMNIGTRAEEVQTLIRSVWQGRSQQIAPPVPGEAA